MLSRILNMEKILVFCLFILGVSSSLVEYDGRLSIKLLHAFGVNTEFTSRGNITVQSIRSGGYLLDQNPLTPIEIDKLKFLAQSDGFYQLQSIVQSPDGTETTFLSSMKATVLLEAGLRDCILIWFLNNGDVMSIAISPSNVESDPPSINFQQLAVPNTFTTEVFMKHMELAPFPDTASYLEKLERERDAREKGELKDNRSFFAKYWMYIVPFVIFILLSGAANPEQQAATR